jgi:hypothetical protein
VRCGPRLLESDGRQRQASAEATASIGTDAAMANLCSQYTNSGSSLGRVDIIADCL